jgi:dTDP-4-dehydrorhamnose reductase
MEMENQFLPSKFEIWGGIECTINRVGDSYYDQSKLTGHYDRPEDLERICSLGISRLRYPVLWEHHQPNEHSTINWEWTTRQLEFLRRNDVEPIAGLVHHGSGPRYTRLDDPLFPAKLAQYAACVAERFPWLNYYTPVNEPLTTARFSGRYGFWYPHHRDDKAFTKMLLNQLKATVLSMQEIRKINPDAKLVQTEDLGKTYSTNALAYQAGFENERRWLSYDFLCGRVDRQHPLWSYLIWTGLSEHEIFFFRDNPCKPDIAGFNYYITSERFLDERLQYYPERTWGGNGKHHYADVEAIRVNHPFPYGLKSLVREAWDRFHIPIALTEAFLSCTPHEQARWLYEVNEQCHSIADGAVKLVALTPWALLGEYAWNNLLTSLETGEYEPGAFDVSNGFRRNEPVASLVEALTGRQPMPHVIEQGWWSGSDRFVWAHTMCLT